MEKNWEKKLIIIRKMTNEKRTLKFKWHELMIISAFKNTNVNAEKYTIAEGN